MAKSVSPEFRLLACCCRWPKCPGAVDEALQSNLDWVLFSKLIIRHRVVGLVNQALAGLGDKVPEDALAQISSASQGTAILALRQAGEASRIFEEMTKAGVASTFIKGSTLSALAYGTLSIKSAYDIDILVRSDQLREAFAAMRGIGYVPEVANDLDEESLLRQASTTKDTTWRHTSRGLVVELHSRLFANERLLPDLPSEPTRDVSIGRNLSLPTLGPTDLLVYLSVHGAVHGWSRLKWLADFNALLSTGSVDVSSFLSAATRHDVDRAANQALLLSSQLFGTKVCEGLGSHWRGDSIARLGARYSLRAMTSSMEKELDEIAMSTVKIQLAQFFIRRGRAYKLAEITAKTRQIDAGGSDSGGRFGPFLIAVIRWVVRRVATKKSLSSRHH